MAVVIRAFEDAENHYQHHEDDAGSPVAPLRDGFHEAVSRVARAETETLVLGAIVATVAGMLFVDAAGVDGGRTVADYGVDILVAAELRNWFNTAFGADISMMELLDTRNTMRTLAATVVAAAFHKEE